MIASRDLTGLSDRQRIEIRGTSVAEHESLTPASQEVIAKYPHNGTRVQVSVSDSPPPWLEPVVDRLTELLGLPADWNSYGALPITEDKANRALDVLDKAMTRDTPPPQIVPTASGGIQLEWHTIAGDVEIEIESAISVAIFYGNERTGETWESEGSLDVVRVREALASILNV